MAAGGLTILGISIVVQISQWITPIPPASRVPSSGLAAGETDRNLLLAMSQETFMPGNRIMFLILIALWDRNHHHQFIHGRLTCPDQAAGKEQMQGMNPGFLVPESSLQDFLCSPFPFSF